MKIELMTELSRIQIVKYFQGAFYPSSESVRLSLGWFAAHSLISSPGSNSGSVTGLFFYPCWY